MILVTGSEGFIGSHVVEALRRDGEMVGGLDMRSAPGLNFHVNITDAWALRDVLQLTKPDAVIHLAAKVGVRDSLNDPVGYLTTNVIGTQNLLDACVKAGVKTVVLASTSSVYGDVQYQVETAIPEPRSPYAASKLGMEALGRVYHELYGMNIACLRLFSVYGERVRPDLMVHQLMDSATQGKPVTVFNEGAIFRDWTFIDDIVSGIRAALDIQGCEVINLGRGMATRLSTIIEWVERLSGNSVNATYTNAPKTEPLVTRADIRKAENLLGYVPKVGVEEGLRRTWAWYNGTQSANLPRQVKDFQNASIADFKPYMFEK